jgi:hypothetical protein
MKCSKCKEKKRSTALRTFGCPFICESCLKVSLKVQAIMDVVFLWPVPKPKKITKSSIIEIPDTLINPADELNGRSHYAIVVSKGMGFFYQNGDFLSLEGLSVGDMVLYDNSLPNVSWYDGMDNKLHPIIRCGYLDIATVVEMKENEDINNCVIEK